MILGGCTRYTIFVWFCEEIFVRLDIYIMFHVVVVVYPTPFE